MVHLYTESQYVQIMPSKMFMNNLTDNFRYSDEETHEFRCLLYEYFTLMPPAVKISQSCEASMPALPA